MAKKKYLEKQDTTKEGKETPESSPNKSKKVSPADWMKRINRAKKFRDQVKDKQEWAKILDMYKGDYKVAGNTITAPPINLVYGYVHTAIPKLYFRDPYICVNPKGAEYIQRAHILEAVINYLVGELGIKKEIAKALVDTLMVGHGWLKYGYSAELGQETNAQENPTDAPVSNVSEYIKNEEIFVRHVPWEDVLFDITLCKDPPYDCRWIAHRIVKPVETWKADSSYQNTEKITANVSLRDTKGEKIDETLKDSDLELFEAWEVFDKDSNKFLTVAESQEDFLKEKENTYEMEGAPYSMLKFNPVPGEPYPLSEIFLIKPQILERIKLRYAQINHMKRWSRQLSVEKGAMTPEEMEKFSQGIDGLVTQREKGYMPPAPIQYAPLQEEIFLLDDLIQRDSDAVIGQTEVDRGGQAKTRTKTLGEVREQQQGSNTRAAARQDKLEDFLEEVFRKVIALLKQFQTTPKYVAITGMKPDELAMKMGPIHSDGQGIHFTKEDIQGEFDVDVKAGSTLPMNKENRVKVIEMILDACPKMGIPPGSPVLMAIGKELVRELDLKEAEQAFDQMMAAPPPPPAPPAPGIPGMPPPGAIPGVPPPPMARPPMPMPPMPAPNGVMR